MNGGPVYQKEKQRREKEGGEKLLDSRGGRIRKKGTREKKRSRTSRERVEVIAQGVDQTRKKEEKKDKDMRKINAGERG